MRCVLFRDYGSADVNGFYRFPLDLSNYRILIGSHSYLDSQTNYQRDAPTAESDRNSRLNLQTSALDMATRLLPAFGPCFSTRESSELSASAAAVPLGSMPFPTTHLRLNTYGHRAFSVAGRMAWNSLPDFIRDPTSSTDCFRRIKRTCSCVTSASSALGVLNDYAQYKSTHSLIHSFTSRSACGHHCFNDQSYISSTSGVARNVNWGPPLPCPLLPFPSSLSLPLFLTGVRGLYPLKFFEIKGART